MQVEEAAPGLGDQPTNQPSNQLSSKQPKRTRDGGVEAGGDTGARACRNERSQVPLLAAERGAQARGPALADVYRGPLGAQRRSCRGAEEGQHSTCERST